MAEKRIRISRPEEKFIYIDKAVGKLLPSAGESELKVLLYALCEQEFSVSEAAAYLNGAIDGRSVGCGGSMTLKELGLYDLTPALCHLDYTMSEAGGVTNFVRQYTLASGGPYCDCGYKKKG